MLCYHCGAVLNDRSFCPNCGTDVSTYKKIIYTSNYYYNEGLQKAQVRDLSGAINALRQSIRFNKNNVEARNLLGLVYFEMGEAVAAISEWVISSNITTDDNLAIQYLEFIQKNQSRVESINQTIKKYNQALTYCYQGSLDLAVIQLKKVLSMNPKFVRAHQLLALLYLHDRQLTRATRELNKCRAIDVNNTTTLRYLREVELESDPETATTEPRHEDEIEQDGIIKYRNGNETIIQPAGAKNPSLDGSGLTGTILNILIGALVGAAVIGFLVLPARVQSVRRDSAEQIRVISEESDEKTSRIAQKDREIEELGEQVETLQNQLTAAGSQGPGEALDGAAAIYIEDPERIEEVAEIMAEMDPAEMETVSSDGFLSLYNALYKLARPSLLTKYYTAGMDAYNAESPDYAEAAKNLSLALRNSFSDSEEYLPILYYLSSSNYRMYVNANEAGRNELAKDLARARYYLTILSQQYPDSEYASGAEDLLDEIRALNIDLDAIDISSETGLPAGESLPAGTEAETTQENGEAATEEGAAAEGQAAEAQPAETQAAETQAAETQPAPAETTEAAQGAAEGTAN